MNHVHDVLNNAVESLYFDYDTEMADIIKGLRAVADTLETDDEWDMEGDALID